MSGEEVDKVLNKDETCIIVDTSILKHTINQLKIDSSINSVSEVIFYRKEQQLVLYTTSQVGPFIRIQLDVTEEVVNLDENVIDQTESDIENKLNEESSKEGHFILDISRLKDFLKSSERGHMIIYPTISNVIFFTMARETNMIHTSNKIVGEEIPLAPFDHETEENNKCSIHISNLKSLFGVLKNTKRKDIELKIYITRNDGQRTKQLVIEVIDNIGGPNIFIISDQENDPNSTEDKISPFDTNSLQRSIQSFEKFFIRTKKRRRSDHDKISLEIIVSYNVFKHVFLNLMDVCEHVQLLLYVKYLKAVMPFTDGNSVCIIPAREIPE